MSKTESAVSEQARDEQRSDSVYDFIYHDVRRVGSFLSQFDDAGILQQVTQSEGATRGSKRGWKATAGGNVSLVGSANIGLERSPEKGGYEASDRVYDPLWANALTLLDFLTERDLLVHGVGSARIGQFVLATGSLTILDLKILKEFLESPAIRDAIFRDSQITDLPPNREFRSGRKAANASRPIPEKSDGLKQMEGGLSLIGRLPHVVQARITSIAGEIAWASLSEDGLVISAADILLKHGTVVAGEWNVLGVLDALPDIDHEGNETGAARDSAKASLATDDNPFGSMLRAIVPIIRPILGRPFGAHGITPLLIFRKISG